MNNRAKLVLAFAVIYLVWGSTYLAIRVGVQTVPSAIYAGARFVLAGLILLGGLGLLRRPLRPTWRDLGRLALSGTLLLVTGNGLVMLAETMVPSGPAALVVATIPLWIAALEAGLPGGERLAARGVAGLALGLGGIAVLSWPQLSGAARQPWNAWGIVVLLAAALTWSAGTLLMRRRPVQLSPLAATGWQLLLGGLINLVVGGLLQGRQPMVWTPAALGALAYLTVFGSVIAFSAYTWLVQNVAPSKVATYAYVNPVVAVLLGHWLLGESLDLYVGGGMAVILLGVGLVGRARTRRAAPAAPRPVEALQPAAQGGD